MGRTTVDLHTTDGLCQTSIFQPENARGPWPAVLFFMDGIGIRPALFARAERLASHGYLVALPDLYYRSGPYAPEAMWKLIMNLETRPEWRAKYYQPANEPANNRRDVTAVLEHLASRADVVQPKIGTTGYCMGGNLSLRCAENFPDRVAACASFHGGSLATTEPDSPHLLAPMIKARVYIAGAVEDPSFTEEMKQKLIDAFRAAGVAHVVETYEGAKHGFAVPDHPVYNEAAAERHWRMLLELFASTLQGDGAR